MKVTDLDRTGEKLTIPEKMTLRQAITTLERIEKYEDEKTDIVEKFDGFVWDAAIAFDKAIKKQFGWVASEPTPIEFMGVKMGEQPPQLVSVAVGLNETVLVPMGRLTLPTVSGFLETSITRIKKDQVAFVVVATVKRKHEDQMQRLFALTRELLATESAYRGKAFKLRINDDDGNRELMAQPKFLNLSRVKPKELVFSEMVEQSISTNLFTPIENAEACRAYKVPLKRGILMYGPYGTGKTLAAHVTAKKCVENGWTFLYCERADELAEMVKLAHQYQPSVVFCEDIDRVVNGERTVAMDDILNIIDGIESKGTELMVILTTNHVENINKALLRPGRLDAVINVLPPDAEAVEKLLRIYGRGLIAGDADLTQVGRELAGTIPAVIRECAERAKLSQLKLGVADGKLTITPEALLDAAYGMKDQLALLAEKPSEKSATERLGSVLQEVVRESHNGDISEIKDLCESIRDNQ